MLIVLQKQQNSISNGLLHYKILHSNFSHSFSSYNYHTYKPMKSPFVKVWIHFLSLQLKHEIYTVSNYIFNLHVHVYQPLPLAYGSTINKRPLQFDPSDLSHYAYFLQTWYLIADTSRKSS